MLIRTPLVYILGPALFAWLLVYLVSLRRSPDPDPVKQAWAQFKLSTIATGTMFVVLWFALPSTPVLSTFGYPPDIDAVKQPQRLLNYLQDYNRALVRTTEVVYWLLFIIVWWFLSAVHILSKSLTLRGRQ